MKPIYIEAKTISDAWFQSLYSILDPKLAYNQQIQKGSFENEQYRLQYPGIMIYIEYPWMDMVPIIPEGMLDDKGNNIASPTNDEFNENYFVDYIMNPVLGENHTYKYSSRIHRTVTEVKADGVNTLFSKSQLQWVIDMLRKTPFTNQAVIEIAQPTDIAQCYGKDGKLDPPCLRLIDFKVIPTDMRGCNSESCEDCDDAGCDESRRIQNVLTVTVYFRSWDLWAGLPVNLAGIEFLKQHVATEAGLINGPMYAYSAGLHVYGYQEKFARIRTMRDKLNKGGE